MVAMTDGLVFEALVMPIEKFVARRGVLRKAVRDAVEYGWLSVCCKVAPYDYADDYDIAYTQKLKSTVG